MAKHRRRLGQSGFNLRWQPLELAQPEPQAPDPDAQELIGQLAEALAAASPAIAVTQVLQNTAKVSKEAVEALLELVGGLAPVRSGFTSLPDPVRAQRQHEYWRRAAYLLSAARRLQQGLRDGTLGSAVETERRYLAQHRTAVARRAAAAQKVATSAEVSRQAGHVGLEGMLGWYSVMDSRTSAECRAANHHNFNPALIPVIGYPGAVHPACRCRPGPPIPGASFLAGSPAPSPVHTEVAASIREGKEQAVRAIELVKSTAYPDLERKPGKQNWVDKAGGLPSYIERIAKHLHYEQGMSISRAIATAVSTVKRWAAGGGNVKADTRAKAAAAVAEWEAKKAASHAD